ncbi:Dchs1, partial [Symbiodinium sp. KB8]
EVVGRVDATDPEGTPLSLSISSGKHSSLFSTSGLDIVLTAEGAALGALDFERDPAIILEVAVKDASAERLSTLSTVTVNVMDMNEVPLLEVGSDATFRVSENAPAGQSIGAPLSARDPDAGAVLRYSLLASAGGLVAIDAASGQLFVTSAGSIDFEALPESRKSLDVSVRVTDEGGLASPAVPITVSVDNVNEAPVMSSEHVRFVVAENAVAETLVGRLSASDPDEAAKGSSALTFSLEGAADSPFALDGERGIVVSKPSLLNHEGRSEWKFTAVATDPSRSVIFNFASHAFDEDAADAAKLAFLLEPSMTDDIASRFLSLQPTGEVSLYYESKLAVGTTMKLGVRVTDSSGSFATSDLIVTISDANFPPVFAALPAGAFKLDEGDYSSTGATIATLITTDEDEDDSATFAIVSDASGTLSVDAATGVVRVQAKPSSVFDHEAVEEYRVVVSATDKAGEVVEHSFSFLVLDVPEAPRCTALPTIRISEGAAVGTTIARMDCSDDDEGDSVSYSVDSPLFAALPDGSITLAERLDFETMPRRTTVVRASDMAGNEVRSELVVHVEDANDAPVVLPGALVVTENVPGVELGSAVVATDQDAADRLEYSISSTNCWSSGSTTLPSMTTVPLLIDAPFVVLHMQELADVELAFTSADGAAIRFAFAFSPGTDAEVTVVNEAGTRIASGSFDALAVYEQHKIYIALQGDAESRSVVRAVVGAGSSRSADGASDLFTSPPVGVVSPSLFTKLQVRSPGSIVKSLCGPNAALATVVRSSLTIESSTGVLSLVEGVSLNHEYTPTIGVAITATDSAGSSDSAAVLIQVLDVNEPPAFHATPSVTIPENSETGEQFRLDLHARDPDVGECGLLLFTLEDNPWITLDGTRGLVTVSSGASLNFEEKRELKLALSVSDACDLDVVSETTLQVNVGDVPEAPKLASAEFKLTIPETASAGDAVDGVLVATDEDLGTTLRFSMVSSSSFFHLSPAGVFTLMEGVELDFEELVHNVHPMVVSVTDGDHVVGGAARISVTNVNEPPTFERSDIYVKEGPVKPMDLTSLASDPEGADLSWALLDESSVWTISCGNLAVIGDK